MIIYKLYMFLFGLKLAVCSCTPDAKEGFNSVNSEMEIKKTGKMPVCINESSGLIKAWQNGYYWTHNDSGGSPELYMIDKKGFIYDTLIIKNANNIDWEDLAKDISGNIYAGDFGNNSGKRNDLSIYKYHNNKTEVINFEYESIKNDGIKNNKIDCEAFLWFNNKLYLFTKIWDKKNKVTLLYELSDQAGKQTAKLVDSMPMTTAVTAADIRPDQKEFVLLSYGKAYFFEIDGTQINFSKPKGCLKTRRRQTEAIAYEDNSHLVFTNEQREIFEISPKATK